MAKKVKKDTCPSCGVTWDQHLGMIGTCAKLEAARTALRHIQAQSFIDNLPHITRLCNDALAEIE